MDVSCFHSITPTPPIQKVSRPPLCYHSVAAQYLSPSSSSVGAAGNPCSSSWNTSSWENIISSLVVQISDAESRPLNVPLLSPFVIASTRLETVRNVAVQIRLTDGSIGWGEVPTLPPVTTENQPVALEMASHACAHLMKCPPATCGQILKELHNLLPRGSSSAVRAGIEMAIFDAVSQSIGLPLWRFFGGCASTIVTDITIPICTPKEAASLASKYAERGFNVLKLKVGGRKIWADLEMILAIRNECTQSQFILDANEGYQPDEALELLKRLDEEGITPILLEQPVPKHNWNELGYVNRVAKDLYGVPIAADESCRSLLDAQRIASNHLADIINIKIAKVGVLGALELIEFANATNIQLMIGGMVETRLGMGFAAHLAAGQGCFKYVDLDTPLLLAEDPVCGGYEADGPVYKLNEALGLGSALQWQETT